MIIKLLRHNMVEHTFFDRASLDSYIEKNIGKGLNISAYGYTIKEEKENG